MTGITGIVQTVPVLFCGGFGRVGAGENNAKFTENCVITLAKVSDFCYNVYRVGIGFDLNFHKKPYYNLPMQEKCVKGRVISGTIRFHRLCLTARSNTG